jgi:hypothetical protein
MLPCVEETVVELLVWVWGSEIVEGDAGDAKRGAYRALWDCGTGMGDASASNAAVYAVTAKRGRF